MLGGEIDRMTAIVEHQLKRAASGGALLGQAPLEIEPLLVDLRAAMMKVYRRKDLSIAASVQPERAVRRRSRATSPSCSATSWTTPASGARGR